ncbi:hypothetical protein ABZ569_33295 [Streptomyces albus]|uniref:hypothetical protein n=1 Tax=Streptomyces albus TaxID=1888 RepID=UPI0033C415AE
MNYATNLSNMPTLAQRARVAATVTTEYLRLTRKHDHWTSRTRPLLGEWAVRRWRALSYGTPERAELDESAYGDAAADLLHHATAAGYNADVLCTLARGLYATSDEQQPEPAAANAGEYAYVLAVLLADIYEAAERAGLPFGRVEWSARLHHDAEQAEATQCQHGSGPREQCTDCLIRDMLASSTVSG